MTERITLEIRDGIAYATLNRPEKMNGLDFPMFDALVEVPARIAKDRRVRAVIMRGEGRAFCAGLDFAGVNTRPRRMVTGMVKLPVQTTNFFQQACWAWRELPVPVIAVLHGHCYGGGIQLALAADFRYTTPDCQLSIMEAKWGLVPDMTGSVTLHELLPMDLAMRLTMTGEVFDGTKAKEYGLVTGVSDDPLKDAEDLAGQIIARSPDSVAATKRLLHETWQASPRAAMWRETVLQARLLTGENHRIARTTGNTDEKPSWRPRSMG
jgi:enoyl-CoA hydratase/carnithine racemase